MLLLQTAPAHSESRRGRERGRSIPFATFPCAAKCGRLRGMADMVTLVARSTLVANDPEPTFSLAVLLPTFDERMLF